MAVRAHPSALDDPLQLEAVERKAIERVQLVEERVLRLSKRARHHGLQLASAPHRSGEPRFGLTPPRAQVEHLTILLDGRIGVQPAKHPLRAPLSLAPHAEV